jgi:hypothetical protein
MTTYVVTDAATGKEVYRYSSLTEIIWDQFPTPAYTYTAIPDPAAPAPASSWQTMAAFDFLRSFQAAERIAARTKSATDPVLDDFYSLLLKADNVHSSDPDLIAGMNYLVSVGVLTQARHDIIMGLA